MNIVKKEYNLYINNLKLLKRTVSIGRKKHVCPTALLSKI